MLTDNIHFLDGAVAGFAIDVPHAYVLGVVEVRQVGQVVNAHPFDGLVLVVSANDLSDLGFACDGTRLDLVVAVHTDVDRRNCCILSFRNTSVAVFTIDLVLTRVDLVRESDRLFGSVPFLNTDGKQRVDHGFKSEGRDDECDDEYESTAAGDRPCADGRMNDFALFFSELFLIEEAFDRRDEEKENNDEQDQDDNHPYEDEVKVLGCITRGLLAGSRGAAGGRCGLGGVFLFVLDVGKNIQDVFVLQGREGSHQDLIVFVEEVDGVGIATCDDGGGIADEILDPFDGWGAFVDTSEGRSDEPGVDAVTGFAVCIKQFLSGCDGGFVSGNFLGIA